MSELSYMKTLLELKKIFKEETDEDEKLSYKQLSQKLQTTLGTSSPIDKRRIKRCIDALNESGFEVIPDKMKFGESVFSHNHRLFETYEVRILVDAVLAAKFLTEEQAITMTEKLRQLTSVHQAKSLPNPIKYNKAMKHISKRTKVYIDRIHEAIRNNKVIKFKYVKYNLNFELEEQRNGQEYMYYPYDTIWDQGFYYLIGQKNNKEKLSHYRIDRMRDVEIVEEGFLKKDYNIVEHMNLNFHMFSGDDEFVEIEFKDKELINPVIDRFGIYANIRKIDEDTFVVKTKATVGPGFYNWLRGWGSKARILAPPTAVEEMKNEIKKMNELYL